MTRRSLHPDEIKVEKDLVRWFTHRAHEHGWKVAHFGNTIKFVNRGNTAIPIADKSAAGFPDMICVRERLLIAELKIAPRKPTAAQVEWLEALDAAGVETHVWTDRQLDEIERTLDAVIEPQRMARLYLASDGNVLHSVAVAQLLAQREGGRS